jgi:hypothetical protein
VQKLEVDPWYSNADYNRIVAQLDMIGTPGPNICIADLYEYIFNLLNGTNIPEIKNVIFNPPATIVFWTDDTKTVVKVQDGDTFDPEHGLAMAIVKKMYGNTGKYCEIFKKWVPYEKIDPIRDLNAEIDAIENHTDVKKRIFDKLNSKETGWIATEYRIPALSGEYLVHDLFTDSVYVYEYDISSANDVIYWLRNITHWMPCPKAPEVKKGE